MHEYLVTIGVVGGAVVAFFTFVIKHWARISALWRLGGRLLVVDQDIAELRKKLEALGNDTDAKIVGLLGIARDQETARATIELRLSTIEAQLKQLIEALAGPPITEPLRNKLMGPTLPQAPLGFASLAPRPRDHGNAMRADHRNAMTLDVGKRKD